MCYWMPITEDELYEWSQCYCWKLPQRPIPEQCNERTMVAAVRRRVTQLREKEEDAIIVAEFAVEATAEGASRIPFFLVETLYGFSAQRTEILRDRYAAFGLKTMVLDAVRKNVCHQAIVDQKFAEEDLDMRLGVKAVLDLFHITPPENCKQLMVAAKHGIDGRGDCLLSSVFDYSRAEPWKCEGLLAGLCDLGKILRQRLSGTELDALNELSGRVAEALKREEVSCYSLIGQLLRGLSPSDVFDPALVLFLSWKYAAERRNGRIDLECISHDVAEAGAGEAVKKALCLFGAFSGFAAMADEYHQMRRGKERCVEEISSSPTNTNEGRNEHA